ncbi:hypothetical protein [Burkholderia cenocepacia]|nr:hypothetical protein [Burkholderia cenocepacia]ONU47732.1 hypothetical protein A8E62_31950 [Burkholderia cenocepacia]ONU51170.1 hypothetical protein A8E67_35525 [Burkholderia cenocepacia]ONU71086.1 hypothetical protein A8E63_40915 [Burkholderia cenocepacia]
MENEKLDYRRIIEGILTDEPFYNQIRQKLYEEDNDTRLVKMTDAVFFFEVLGKSEVDIDGFVDILPLCSKEEQYELIYRFMDSAMPFLNAEWQVIEDTQGYVYGDYNKEEILNIGFATIKDSTFKSWTKEQQEAYKNRDYENIPEISSDDWEWDNDELFQFRCNEAYDLAYGIDEIVENELFEFEETENTVYFYMTDLQMQAQLSDDRIQTAITNTFANLDMNHIQCLDDLVALTNARSLHGKLTDEMAQSDKPTTKAQQLSNDIEGEDFTYKPSTTKTNKAKV